MDKIIKTVNLPSGTTAVAFEFVSDGVGVGIKIGSGGGTSLAVDMKTDSAGLAFGVDSGYILLSEKDIYDFIRLLKEVDKIFLKK